MAAPASTPKSEQWWTKDPKEFNLFQKIISMDLGPNYKEKIVTGPAPKHSVLREHAFIIPWAVAPIALQYISQVYLGRNWSRLEAFGVYTGNLMAFGLTTVRRLRILGEKYGHLDAANRERDRVAQNRVTPLVLGLLATISVRTMLAAIVAYRPGRLPNITWKLPIDMSLYMVAVDFFFYIYHRALHQVPWLWKIHRTHHSTKHPTSLMAPLADHIQETFDILVIPLLAYTIRPIPFFHWYIACLYVNYIELTGHSGIRADMGHPVVGPILRAFGLDLVVEDHDLHHRLGKRAGNFGKQTRIFDTLFGTTSERYETTPEAIGLDKQKSTSAPRAAAPAQ
jgi:sterol desaturase/sphingolipid hydroxylase (fatty acid hydroxylase superfamily)